MTSRIRAAVLVGSLAVLPGCPGCNDSPVAIVASSSQGGPLPLCTVFDASGSRDPDGSITSFEWNFGDGETGTGAKVSHIFTAAGSYQVSLTARDNDGASSRSQVLVSLVEPHVTKLPGYLGGSPAKTAIYRADIGNTSVLSLTIKDGGGTDGAGGRFSGFDLDAVVLSTTLCNDAECVDTLTQLAVFDLSPQGTFFSPGGQETPRDAKLHGTDETGAVVDFTLATLGACDANSSTSNPGGDVSLGLRGSLTFNLTGPASGSPLYLYFGEVADNSEAHDGDIVVASIRIDGKKAIIGAAGGFLSACSAALWVPPAVATGDVELEMRGTLGGGVSIRPSRHYSLPAWLVLPDSQASMQRLHGTPPAWLPSCATPAGRIGFLYGHSEFARGGPIQACPGGVANCVLQEVHGTDDGAAGCYSAAVGVMEDWFVSEGLKKPDHSGNDQAGGTLAICQYPTSLDAQITVTQTGPRQFQVDIPRHMPTMASHVYVPAKAYLRRLNLCSGERSAVDHLYQTLLDHEMEHVRVNQNLPGHTWGGTSIPINIPPGQDIPSVPQLKAFAYQESCNNLFKPVFDQAHQLVDDLAPDEAAGLSAGCNNCDSGAPTDRCAQASYCPCNSPGEGKPRSYSSQTECAARCPGSLRCFSVLCTRPPDCPSS